MSLPKALLLTTLVSIAAPSFGALRPIHVEGQWTCDPYTIEGKGISVTTVDQPTYAQGGAFTELSTSTIALDGGVKIVTNSKLLGSWKLVGDVIEISFSSAQFLSSNNPSYTGEMGQRDLDAQMQKKNWSKRKVIESDRRLVTRSIDVMYKEAEVSVSCTVTSKQDR